MNISKTPQRTRKLKARSYKNQVIENADFSNADIRGINFSHATLRSANFNRARAGQPTIWVVGLGIVALLLMVLVGAIAGFVSLFVSALSLSPNQGEISGAHLTIGLLSLLILSGMTGLTFWRGLSLALVGWGGLFLLLATVLIIPTGVEVGVQAFLLSFAIEVFFLNTIAGAIIVASRWQVGTRLALPALCLLMSTGTVAVISQFHTTFLDKTPESLRTVSYLVLVCTALLSNFLCVYLAWSARRGSLKYSLIQDAVVAVNSWGGTRFTGADLTGADFSQTVLERTDFRRATLSYVRWLGAQRLGEARISQTYLVNPQLRQLLTTLNAQGQVFDGLSLRYLDLHQANLQDASFIGSDLGDADLREANLCQAKLVRTQLYQADLRGAHLSGSYIQDWGISVKTQLEDVHCDYIYMRLPTQVNPDPLRKPDNLKENFQPGDFANFITPIIKTLDLYQRQNFDPRQVAETFNSLDLFHRDGLDPTAAAIAFNQLTEENPQAGLKLVALDGRGHEKVRLQAQVANSVDKTALSTQYFEKYQQAQALPYLEQQSLMATITEKDKHIQSLEGLLKSAITSGESYIKVDGGQATTKILILSANPQGTNAHQLALEVREISNGLQRAKQRDQFEIISKWAVRSRDLQRALLDYEPQIVHFSGCGSLQEGLALEDELGQVHCVSSASLAGLFSLFRNKVECVFLNACYSEVQAQEICKHIRYVVGTHPVPDEQAIAQASAVQFAVGFYDALGAGRSIEEAFEFGRVAIEIEGLSMAAVPSITKSST
ncbi:MAG: pentapeptide repeat-containing protein [Cyanobacteria bacterium J06559_1]